MFIVRTVMNVRSCIYCTGGRGCNRVLLKSNEVRIKADYIE